MRLSWFSVYLHRINLHRLILLQIWHRISWAIGYIRLEVGMWYAHTANENIATLCLLCVQIMLSTAECLALLQQKPLGSRMQMPSSRDKDNMKPMGPLHAAANNYHEGPLSSDVSPVSTVEKRACLLLPTRTSSPQPFCGLNPPVALSNGCHHGMQYGNDIYIFIYLFGDRRMIGQRQSTWGSWWPPSKFFCQVAREEISELGKIEPPTSSLRFGYLYTIIQ